ncbi:MAG: DUF4235 domain-containing protein [Mycobacteriales bacterium]
MALAKIGWKVVGVASGLFAVTVSKKALEATWRKTHDGADPPRNPAAPGTTWIEALSWAAASGIALAAARLLASRGAASAWQKTTGRLPPGLEEVGA